MRRHWREILFLIRFAAVLYGLVCQGVELLAYMLLNVLVCWKVCLNQ